MRRKFLGIIILFLIPLALFAEDELVTIQVRGEGKVVGGNLAKARRLAINQAHETALALQVEGLVEEKTLLANSSKLEQRIYKRVGTFIKSYKEIQTERMEDLLLVTIEAIIDLGLLKRELAVAGLLAEQGVRPRIIHMVSFERRGDGASHAWWVGDPTALWEPVRKSPSKPEKTLINFFKEYGFEVVDPYVNRLGLKLPEVLRDRGVTIPDAQAVGRLVGASYVIKGDLITKPSEKHNGKDQSRLSLQVVDVSRGILVASAADEVLSPSRKGVSEIEIALVNQVGKTLVERLGSEIARMGVGSQRLEVVVSGVANFPMIKMFEKWLINTVPHAKEITPRRMTRKEVVFLVDYRGSIQSAARALRANQPEGYSIMVTVLDGSRLLVQVTQ
ncbi:hypothetical protein ACFLRA_01805 [Bdellovibrionota bacterium]